MTVALNDLLAPLKLAYRPIDARTLQVTTQSALAARLELEFYPVGKMLGKDGSTADLIERIKTSISPSLWRDAAGAATIYFDQPSSTLIVLQTPSVHVAIQALLNQIKENKNKGAEPFSG